ncbi:MAG: hypothetical protein CTY12_09120 [Methylotenera sp.]|nr:MAG: hypothetical protein CK423_10020 [Legionella sp.]PPD50883.1 MAG: hypothetical protein CTY12_09120 [Methylotenera sp.]
MTNIIFKFALLSILATQISFVFAADCATKEYIMTNWTGQCVNGKAQGQGSGKANYSAENYSIDVVGKFQVYKNGAYKTGLYFEDWGAGQSKKIKVYRIDESASASSDIGKEILSCICIEGCKPHITLNSIWSSYGNRNEVLDKSETKFTTEQLISLVYANLQNKGIDSMDPVTFKSFLFAEQTKAVVAEKQKLLDMADEPPVKGVRLSLGGDAKPAKKSKKKN